MASLGARAAAVSIVAGVGEFLGYSLRAVSGYLADRTGKYWPSHLCVRSPAGSPALDASLSPFSRAYWTISGVMSMPLTKPVGPTSRAARNTSKPAAPEIEHALACLFHT
jgi:hypothetical protein